MNEDSVFDGSSVLLTGGTGFLGNHLREVLAEKNADVTVLVRPSSTIDTKDNEDELQGDISDDVRIDVSGQDFVIHLAAQTSVESSIREPNRTWDINATGTRNVLEACRGEEVRVFLASTASVYGTPSNLPISEEDPMNVQEPYGASKAAADLLAQSYHSSYGLDVTIARFFNVFGPGQPKHNVISTILRQALEGGPIELGNMSPSRDFIFVEDAISAVVTLIESGDPGVAYNVGRGEDVSIREITEMVTELVGDSLTVHSLDDIKRDDDIEIPRHVADTTRLRSLGWKPKYSVSEGLSETITAMQDE